MFFAKIVQTSGMTKEKTKFFFFIPECSLYYSKIVQMSGMAKLWRTYCSSETYKKY